MDRFSSKNKNPIQYYYIPKEIGVDGMKILFLQSCIWVSIVEAKFHQISLYPFLPILVVQWTIFFILL